MKYVHGWAFPDADDQMAREIAPDGSYQRAHLEAALRHVRHFTTAIDAGAHVGTWSHVLSAHFARVLAFEPSPDTCEALTANMTAFGCANVTIHQAALGAAPGMVRIAPLAPAAAVLKNTGARFVQPGGDIPVVTIDSFELAEVGFVKLDIEGSEPAALRGALQTLKRCKPVVLFENKWLWAKNFRHPKHAVRDLLTLARYRFVEQIGHDQIWIAR